MTKNCVWSFVLASTHAASLVVSSAPHPVPGDVCQILSLDLIIESTTKTRTNDFKNVREKKNSNVEKTMTLEIY